MASVIGIVPFSVHFFFCEQSKLAFNRGLIWPKADPEILTKGRLVWNNSKTCDSSFMCYSGEAVLLNEASKGWQIKYPEVFLILLHIRLLLRGKKKSPRTKPNTTIKKSYNLLGSYKSLHLKLDFFNITLFSLYEWKFLQFLEKQSKYSKGFTMGEHSQSLPLDKS